MHKLYTVFIFTCFSVLPISLHAQQPKWYWATEISVTSRMGNRQVLQPIQANFNLEWRNRLGLEIANQLFMGVQGHIRTYSNVEEFYKI